MDAEQTLAFMRSRNRADIELPSGLWARIGLVRLQDAITAGSIPVPILKEMDALAAQAKPNGHKPRKPPTEPSAEVIAHGTSFRHEMARRTLKSLAASQAELGDDVDMPSQVIDELTQEDFDTLAGYALRDTPFPTAVSPA